MAKTQEELKQLKIEYETLNNKLKELNEEELKVVTGGEPSSGEYGIGNSIISDRALSCVGLPYIWGSAGPDGYDESGLVSYSVTGDHVMIGTCTTFMNWNRVDSPSTGDICVSFNHCGIYVGGGSMVHAPADGQTVCVSSVHPDMIFVRKP